MSTTPTTKHSHKPPAKPPAKRSPKKFVNNADLLTEIKIGKQKMADNPDLLPAECMTPKLARMVHTLVENYARRKNWSGYTYVEEFVGAALLNLCANWHRFDEERGNNPFAYYTQAVERSFTGQHSKEKRVREIRDAMLIDKGMLPSYDAQINHQRAQKEING